MIRTVPVEDNKLRVRALIWGSIVAIVGPFLIGLPITFFGAERLSLSAHGVGVVLVFSPIVSIPAVLMAGLYAKQALRRGFAGPLVAVVSGCAIGACFGAAGYAILNAGTLAYPDAILEVTQFYGAAGTLWALAYWFGIWFFVPEAVERPTS